MLWHYGFMIQSIKNTPTPKQTSVRNKKKGLCDATHAQLWCDFFMYFSSDERQDVHLPRLALFDRGYDEAGAAQDDLPSGPAVDW